MLVNDIESLRGEINDMKHTDRSQSRRVTPWDDDSEITPSQSFIQRHYREHYMQRHPKLDETGEVELINSYVPTNCPYCREKVFQKHGHTRIRFNTINTKTKIADKLFCLLQEQYLMNTVYLSANG